jgi:glycosyltransferase involved in cell wall biosynthesis
VSRVLLVDWLGRGGIAQTTACWAAELRGEGREVEVVTRGGRELSQLVPGAMEAGEGLRQVAAHRAVVEAAASAIRATRPDTVVVQNYVLPVLEQAVYRAADDVGARLVAVIHDHRMHTVLAGNGIGLRRNLGRADAVATHSHFVADGVSQLTAAPLTVLPLVMFVPDTSDDPHPRGPGLTAVHFGILKRRYKGTALVAELAKQGVPGWKFTLVGAGAPTSLPGAMTIPHFADAGNLMALVGGANVALLPYSIATQSGAVALAQALGTVPVASAVGGIPEQIIDGQTGRLVPADVGATAWRAVLQELAADPAELEAIGKRARAQAWNDFDHFRAGVLALTA